MANFRDLHSAQAQHHSSLQTHDNPADVLAAQQLQELANPIQACSFSLDDLLNSGDEEPSVKLPSIDQLGLRPDAVATVINSRPSQTASTPSTSTAARSDQVLVLLQQAITQGQLMATRIADLTRSHDVQKATIDGLQQGYDEMCEAVNGLKNEMKKKDSEIQDLEQVVKTIMGKGRQPRTPVDTEEVMLVGEDDNGAEDDKQDFRGTRRQRASKHEAVTSVSGAKRKHK